MFPYHGKFYCSPVLEVQLGYRGLFIPWPSPLPPHHLLLEPTFTTTLHPHSANAAASSLGLLDSHLSKTVLHPGRECTRDSCKAVPNAEPGSNSNTRVIGVWSHYCFWTFHPFCPQIHAYPLLTCVSIILPALTLNNSELSLFENSSNFRHLLSVSRLWLVNVGSVSPMQVWEMRSRLKAFTSFHRNSPMSAQIGTWWNRKNTSSHGILTLCLHISVLGSANLGKLWTPLSLPSSPVGIITKTMSLWLLHNNHI